MDVAAVHFAAPLFLALLALVPIGVVLYVVADRRRRRGRAAFASPALLPAVAPRPPGGRRHVPIAFYVLALAALAVALARPERVVAVDDEQASVMLVFDRSGSMAATDVKPTRMEAARRAADQFLKTVPKKVRVGLVAYSSTPRALQGPTRDRDEIRAALDEVQPGGGTRTGDALDLAIRVARRPAQPGGKPPPAAIVLLSDGKATGHGKDAVAVARQARKLKVKVYTVALGTPDGTIATKGKNGATRQQRVPPDPKLMRDIAQVSGGRTFAVQDTGKLQAVYAGLGSQVAKVRRPREVTAAVAAGALLALVLGGASSLRLFGRLP